MPDDAEQQGVCAAPKAFPELAQLLLLALLLQLPHWGLDCGQGFLPRMTREGGWDSAAIAAGMACLLRQFPAETATVRIGLGAGCTGQHQTSH